MQDGTTLNKAQGAGQGAARAETLGGALFLADAPLTEGLVFARRQDGLHTNIPCVVRHHSPAGWGWGYGGSGAADLALNCCEALLKELGWRGERVECSNGSCFTAAWQMHQDFKRRFIGPLPYGGGRVEYGVVRQWVLDWLAAVYEWAPLDELLAAAGLTTTDGKPFEDWDAWEQG